MMGKGMMLEDTMKGEYVLRASSSGQGPELDT
jgi:hypothetical protein